MLVTVFAARLTPSAVPTAYASFTKSSDAEFMQ